MSASHCDNKIMNRCLILINVKALEKLNSKQASLWESPLSGSWFL